ncbi:hypothetical protein MYAM1_001522 [Malassezia yamatoensis]|uniref:Major facilitator superfamily (MFS) profile domain-containing protein n=1 Tax=Malassezia yamatoensis TaxID=253288 RepID=A0AAJ5YRH6_9BASI|nr:hypothetical protein MYAM1_001522 [Malassezia yamatoensis]
MPRSSSNIRVDLEVGKQKEKDGIIVHEDVIPGEAFSHDEKTDYDTTARLANPLLGVPFDKLQEDVNEFSATHGLEEYRELLFKGALCAQAQATGDYDSITVLNEEDRQALRDEKEHRWRQPIQLYWLCVCCSVAAAVQGADETVINGALLFFPEQFNIGSNSDRDQWLTGLVASAPYIGCAFIGCWLTQPLNAVFGRRGTIFVTSFVSFASCIWQACTNTWWHMFIARLVLGLGIGPKSATVPMFSAECTPPLIRGALVMQWQSYTAFGVMIGYVLDLIFYKVQSTHVQGLNWRLMMGSAAVPALFVMAQIYFCPESPRWLMKKGKYEQAMRSFLRLRNVPLLAARDLYFAHRLLEEEDRIIRSKGRFLFLELFTVPRNLRATIGATIVMFGQQFCGVNVISFFSSNIIVDLGKTTNINAMLGSWGFGMLAFLFTIPAWFMIDVLGRRSLLLWTFPFMIVCLLITGFSFWIPDSHSDAKLGLLLMGIYVYVCFYAMGIGPVPFTYCAEAFPLYIREVGMAYGTMVLWFFNAVLAITWFRMEQVMKPQGAFGFYAAWCAVLWVLVLFFLPETKALTLEQLDVVFSMPTRKHAGLRLREARNRLFHIGSTK